MKKVAAIGAMFLVMSCAGVANVASVARGPLTHAGPDVRAAAAKQRIQMATGNVGGQRVPAPTSPQQIQVPGRGRGSVEILRAGFEQPAARPATAPGVSPQMGSALSRQRSASAPITTDVPGISRQGSVSQMRQMFEGLPATPATPTNQQRGLVSQRRQMFEQPDQLTRPATAPAPALRRVRPAAIDVSTATASVPGVPSPTTARTSYGPELVEAVTGSPFAGQLTRQSSPVREPAAGQLTRRQPLSATEQSPAPASAPATLKRQIVPAEGGADPMTVPGSPQRRQAIQRGEIKATVDDVIATELRRPGSSGLVGDELNRLERGLPLTPRQQARIQRDIINRSYAG